MDGVDAVLLGNPDNGGYVEISLDWSAVLWEEEGLVGVPPVRGVTIFVPVDGDGLKVQLGGGTEDTYRDLSAIRCDRIGRVDGAGAGGLA